MMLILIAFVLKITDADNTTTTGTTTPHHTILRPFFRDHPGELVQEENL